MSKHTITLNNGAMVHLASLFATPGLIKDPAHLTFACLIAEEYLCDVPRMPAEVEKKTGPEALPAAYGWMRAGEHKLELSEKRRDACKEIIKGAVGHGMLRGDPGSACLLREFGLSAEE